MLNEDKLKKIYKEEIQLETKLRSKSARLLMTEKNNLLREKLSNENNSGTGMSTNNNERVEKLEQNIVKLESEVKLRTNRINRKQGYLTDHAISQHNIDIMCNTPKESVVSCSFIY